MFYAEAESFYEQIINDSRDDPNVLGLFLGGSRGTGITSKYSDYDVVIVVADGQEDTYKEKHPRRGFEKFDLSVISLSRFDSLEPAWDRYGSIRITALIKTLIGKQVFHCLHMCSVT